MVAKKSIIALVLIGSLIGVAAASVIITQFYLPWEVTVGAGSLPIDVYLEGTLWENDTIAIDDLMPGTSYPYSLNVYNNDTTTLKIYLKSTGFPTGWTETWTANNTYIEPGYWANGTYTITVPSDADGVYEWTTIITAEKPP